MKPPETPELVKIRAYKDKSQKIGEFIEWLGEQGMAICERDRLDEYNPTLKSTEKLLAGFFKIDLNAVENERRALLDYQRSLNDRSGHDAKMGQGEQDA